MVAWKAVSKQATAGAPGSSAVTASSAARLGLMQRGEVGQGPQLLPHRTVDQDRAGEHRPAVHDTVADRIGLTPPPQDPGEAGGVESAGPGGQVSAVLDGVPGVEQAQLEAG